MKIKELLENGGPHSSGGFLPTNLLETVDGKNLHLE